MLTASPHDGAGHMAPELVMMAEPSAVATVSALRCCSSDNLLTSSAIAADPLRLWVSEEKYCVLTR